VSYCICVCIRHNVCLIVCVYIYVITCLHVCLIDMGCLLCMLTYCSHQCCIYYSSFVVDDELPASHKCQMFTLMTCQCEACISLQALYDLSNYVRYLYLKIKWTSCDHLIVKYLPIIVFVLWQVFFLIKLNQVSMDMKYLKV